MTILIQLYCHLLESTDSDSEQQWIMIHRDKPSTLLLIEKFFFFRFLR